MALTSSQKQLVQSTFVKVALIADQAAALFYSRLFEIEPSVQVLFAKTDMKEQGRKLMQMIGTAVSGLDRLEAIVPDVQALGKRHVAYGVKKEHYAVVGEALLWTLEKGLGADFTPEVKDAWATVYGILAQTAIDAAYAPGEPVQAASGNGHKATQPLSMTTDKPTREEVLAHLQTNKDLIGLNLAGLNLSGVNMIGANLSGANLAHAQLTGANLVDANLSGANLSGAQLAEARLTGAKLIGANLTATNLAKSELTQADLSGAVLTAATLTQAIMEKTRLYGTYFICAEMSGANLREANLTGAVLTGANLSKVNLQGAILRGTNMTVANLTEASLEGAKLVGVIGMEQPLPTKA
jgi:uncharacterized protein YjbI with pentapeptide repeats/hemoglobin-like flavoprotein